MALSAKQQAARDGKVTCSFLNPLCAGQTGIILDKWKELIGDPSWRPADYSRNWSVQLGVKLEQFVLDWEEVSKKQELSRRGEVVVHPARPWFCGTLDAWREADRTVVDVKVVHAGSDLDATLGYYSPQLLGLKECTGAANATLLVVRGGAEPAELQAFFSDEWAASVWRAAEYFQWCVETLTPPVAVPPVPPPPEQWVKIDLDAHADRFNWAPEMIEQLDLGARTALAAEQHAGAKAAIKELLPADCAELRHSGRLIKRARNRAVTIRFS